MNILMISHLYYPTIGGVQVATSNLIKECLKNGHRIELITSRWPKTLPKTEFVDGVKVTRLPFRLPSLNPISFLKFLIQAIECIWRLFFIARRTKFDVINLHYVSENALYALMLSYFKHIPLVTHIHGADIEDFALRSRFNKWLVARTLKRSTCIISNSAALLEVAVKTFGETILDKSTVITNGTNLSEFDQLENNNANLSPYLLGIGRFVHKKGFDILLKSFALVKNKFPNIKLVLVGDGVERSKLETLSQLLGLEQSVVFCGSLEHKEVLKFLAGCEFFVLPSRKEPFGIVNLEAMATKKAVIAMDVGGVSEIVQNGVNGILLKDRSPRSLADAIISLLNNPTLARRLGMNGRKMVELNYTWENIGNRYLKIYRSALEI